MLIHAFCKLPVLPIVLCFIHAVSLLDETAVDASLAAQTVSNWSIVTKLLYGEFDETLCDLTDHPSRLLMLIAYIISLQIDFLAGGLERG